LPYIPTEKEIDQLIGGFSDSKYGPFLQLLKETAFRPIEASRLKPMDFDLERRIERIEVCPYCGQQIRKWAIRCPYCRSDLSMRARY
jgi:hypothetical protein